MQQHGWIFEAILSKHKTILRAAGLCEELCTLSFWSSLRWQALTIAHFLAAAEAASRGWRAVALTLGIPHWSPQRMKSTGGGKCLPWWWGWRSPFAWTSGLKLSCFSGQEVDRNLSSVPLCRSYLGSLYGLTQKAFDYWFTVLMSSLRWVNVFRSWALAAGSSIWGLYHSKLVILDFYLEDVINNLSFWELCCYTKAIYALFSVYNISQRIIVLF